MGVWWPGCKRPRPIYFQARRVTTPRRAATPSAHTAVFSSPKERRVQLPSSFWWKMSTWVRCMARSLAASRRLDWRMLSGVRVIGFSWAAVQRAPEMGLWQPGCKGTTYAPRAPQLVLVVVRVLVHLGHHGVGEG